MQSCSWYRFGEQQGQRSDQRRYRIAYSIKCFGGSRNKQKTNFREPDHRHVDGEELLSKIKNLVKEGNIRRIIIKNKDGEIVMEIPVTIGVVGALIAPQLAALGAIAALVTEATVVVEKAE